MLFLGHSLVFGQRQKEWPQKEMKREKDEKSMFEMYLFLSLLGFTLPLRMARLWLFTLYTRQAPPRPLGWVDWLCADVHYYWYIHTLHIYCYCSRLAGLSVQYDLKHRKCSETVMSNTNSILKTYIDYKILLKISNAIWNKSVWKSVCACFMVTFSKSLVFLSFTVLSRFGGSK